MKLLQINLKAWSPKHSRHSRQLKYLMQKKKCYELDKDDFLYYEKSRKQGRSYASSFSQFTQV